MVTIETFLSRSGYERREFFLRLITDGAFREFFARLLGYDLQPEIDEFRRTFRFDIPQTFAEFVAAKPNWTREDLILACVRSEALTLNLARHIADETAYERFLVAIEAYRAAIERAPVDALK